MAIAKMENKVLKYKKVISLRKKNKSLREIEALTGVDSTTVSRWVNQVGLGGRIRSN